MQIFKISLVIMTGLGAAWTADQVTTRLNASDGDAAPADVRVIVAQSDAATPETGPVDAPASDSEQEALSEAEIDAELERIEKAASGATDELEEFVPTKPLAADIPLALPSDI